MAWIRQPQELKNSPTLFGEALVAYLSTSSEETPSCTLLQYVDNLLLASHNCDKCCEGMKALLTQLSEAGYKVS
jgi:hypothetical protein